MPGPKPAYFWLVTKPGLRFIMAAVTSFRAKQRTQGLMRQAGQSPKLISPDQAAALVQSGMWLDYATGISQPDLFDAALAKRIPELKDLKIRGCLTVRPRLAVEADPHGEHVHYFNWHFSGYDRKLQDKGRCNYIPLNLGEVPDYYRRFIDPPDILIIKARPMDGDGHFNFSATNMWHRALVERAKLVIVETAPNYPHVQGDLNSVHVSEVDYVIEGDGLTPAELKNPVASDVDRAVAKYIAGEIDDGACLQIGIGGMPNAVCSLLMDSHIPNMGVHTEMLTDGIVDLYRAGKISGAQKKLNPGKVVFTFAMGSQTTFDTLHNNPDFHCVPVDYTNAPHVIMQNDKVVSINNTTKVDLQGQAASESDGHRQISGTGGQLQFVRGAYASTGGKSFICLASTYESKGQVQSRIVLDLNPGTIVTTPRSDVMYVVTEYGITNLKGKSVAERARALIHLAHPDFREGLERQAYESGAIPRGFK
jgi:acyl-CoA hydrolase